MTIATAPFERDLPSPAIDVRLVIFLSIVTLGIYPAFWAMNRIQELKMAGHGENIWMTIPYGFLSVAILSIPLLIVDEVLGHTVLGPIVDVSYLGLGYWSVFIVRARLKGAGVDSSLFLTILFTHMYIQYKINRAKD